MSAQDPIHAPRHRRGRLNPFLRKPLWVILKEDDGCNRQSTPHDDVAPNDNDNYNEPSSSLGVEMTTTTTRRRNNPPRHLTLFDLVSIGVGGTVGSGIFVLNGLIARDYAGPATPVSWTLSGMAAMLSGCCYAELSGRIPVAGSSYAYAFVALGELPAFVTAGMLTLEFLLSGSAVARSWGDKVVGWMRVQLNVDESVLRILDPGYGINPAACLLSIATTMIVVRGVKESKIVTDFFTWIKVLLVAFMIVGGFVLFDGSNLEPFVPPEFGASGVLRGAVSSFFGYLGFDAMACVAGEAINAERNLPLSIMITLAIVTTLYVAAAIALVGMQSYDSISPESGFPVAFKSNGVEWASQLTAFGEVFTLPVVVLISIVIQPRLQYALANDGLLPSIFGEVDESGNSKKGALIAGVIMTIFATFVPFSYLEDFVSAGILMAFIVTNSSLIIMRRKSPEANPYLLQRDLTWFNLISFLTCLATSHISWVIGCVLGPVSVFIAAKISWQCPPATSFGHTTDKTAQRYAGRKYFSTPFVPYLPCVGIFVNYFLISQLAFMGIALLFAYVLLLVLLYFLYGAHNSVGRKEGWEEQEYLMIESNDDKSHKTRKDGVMT